MKKFTFIRRFLLATLLFVFAPLGASAQTTIGSGRVPSTFALLDLDTQPDVAGQGLKTGLHLPRLTAAERNALQAKFSASGNRNAEGLRIFNITSKCVETWNGSVWMSACAK